VTDTTQSRPFDEQNALEELERLAERIQSSRRQREQAVAEFDAFVKTFRDDQQAARLRAVEALPVPASAERRVRLEESQPPHRAEAPPVPPTLPIVPESATAVIPQIASSSSPAANVLGVRRDLLNVPYARFALAGAGLLVVLLMVLWLRGGSAPPPQTTPSPQAPAAQPPAAQSPAGTESKPVASSGSPRAVNVQLVILRPVWARVIVDDRKVIERELAGGQTIPLGADRLIAIRAGDAGAVRLIVDGKDQGALGRDGQPATRTFAAR
jgi:hypothetical protein